MKAKLNPKLIAVGACATLLALCCGTTPSPAQPPAREVHVLAAADLQPVLPALAEAFEHATGIKIIASYGSSSALTAQIINGDPADLFLAADYSFPDKIVGAGLADSPTAIPYARGTLVLWARKDSSLQPLTQNTLREAKFTSLAIANPTHAPYGRAAIAVLTTMKLDGTLKTRLVEAENIAQTAQFVESGNAQLGMISLTAASTQHMKDVGTYVVMPAVAYPPIRQCAVVMKKSAHRADAHVFLDWLRSPAIQRNLPHYGLDKID
jgi:molybdate transport system substrate-binding protein